MLHRNVLSTSSALLLALLLGVAPYAVAVAPPAYSYQAIISSPLIVPSNVDTDSSGNLYVVDLAYKQVLVLSPTGSLKFTISRNDAPVSVAVDFNGRIFVGYLTDGQPGYVAIYEPDGRFIRLIGSGYGEFGNPVNIAVSLSTGRIYVLDALQNKVKVYESGGEPALKTDGAHLQFGSYGHNSSSSPLTNPGKLDNPSGIAIDNIRNEVLIADQGNYRVQIFDMNGNFKTAFGGKAATTNNWGTERPPSYLVGKFMTMRGLSVDSLGRIYVADEGLATVQVLDRSGNFLAFIGEPGFTPDKLIAPKDCTIDNANRLIIVDVYLRRASIFGIDAGPAIPNVAPEAPVKMGPTDGTLFDTTTPVLAVYNSKDINNHTLAYRFEIDSSPYFNSIDLITFTTPQGTPYTGTQTPPLHSRGTYFWRVRAEETSTQEHLVSQWSVIGSFSIFVNNAPSTPFGLLPGDGSILKKADLLNWGPSTDPNTADTVTYSIELSENADFSRVIQSRAGMTTLTISVESLFAGTTIKGDTRYYWHVKAVDNYGASSAWSGAGSFFVFVNLPPSVPAGLVPANDGMVKKTDSLGWGASNDPNAGDTVSYSLELSETADFSKVIQSRTGMSGTTIGVESLFAGITIKGDTRYYWHVKAVDNRGDSSAWSGTSSFFVFVNLPPSVPAGLVPANDSMVKKTDSLGWATSTDPNAGDTVTYSIELSETSNFSTVIHSQTGMSGTIIGVESLFAGTAIKSDTRYFWHVKATDSYGASSEWSGSGSFIVILNLPPSTPTNLMPGNDSLIKKTDSLGWGASTDPNAGDVITYTTELSETADFAKVIHSRTGMSATTIAINTLAGTVMKADTRYFWRVRAVDSYGASSAWSSTANFVYTETRLLITSSLEGVRVYLDGNYSHMGRFAGKTGASPLTITDITPGRHVIRLEKEGYFGHYASIVIEDGKAHAFTASLTRNTAGTRSYSGMLFDGKKAFAESKTKSQLEFAKPFLVDWNNDGKKDMLVGDKQGKVYLFLNIASDAAPDFRLSPNHQQGVVADVGSRAVPFVVDWNNDGKKDLLVGSGNGMVWLYLNEGSSDAPRFASGKPLFANASSLRVSENAAPFVVDWNNDGKKDLLVGESSGRVRLFINTGNDESPLFAATGNVVQGLPVRARGGDLRVDKDAVPFVTDFNLDGAKDLVIGGEHELTFFFNQGTDAAPLFNTATPLQLGHRGIAPLIADYGNDGYTDLIAGDEKGDVRYYQFRVMNTSPRNPAGLGLVQP